MVVRAVLTPDKNVKKLAKKVAQPIFGKINVYLFRWKKVAQFLRLFLSLKKMPKAYSYVHM
jgi:hypothetical protein